MKIAKLTLQRKKDFLFAFFVGFMVLVNTLGSKVTTIFGVRMSVGIFFMPVLFLITDVIGEVCGKKEASRFVTDSTIVLVVAFLMILLCVKVKPNPTYADQASYETVFYSSLRMTAASIISFVISQSFDVFIFDFIRGKTGGKHLWIRNNLSTICSQFVDTTIFMFIAFYHINEKYTASFVFSLIIPYWCCKIVFALLDTPFCYLGVKWLKGSEE